MLRGPEAPARNARRRPVSHDGKRIAFASNRDDPAVWRIYVMDSGGSRVVLVAPTEDRATVPRWSADGKESSSPIARRSTAERTATSTGRPPRADAIGSGQLATAIMAAIGPIPYFFIFV
jgi:dipeptidyl aminopeptidase/acylaminoacyl peptidase